jgi:hypothetical protein
VRCTIGIILGLHDHRRHHYRHHNSNSLHTHVKFIERKLYSKGLKRLKPINVFVFSISFYSAAQVIIITLAIVMVVVVIIIIRHPEVAKL